jgi:N-methylhydantoinase A/oxoprolinase/acetone carboxylase beta subunit
LVLGRLVPEDFPAIFGPGANEPLDRAASLDKFEALAAAINETLPPAKHYTVDQVAAGFIKVASKWSFGAVTDDQTRACPALCRQSPNSGVSRLPPTISAVLAVL